MAETQITTNRLNSLRDRAAKSRTQLSNATEHLEHAANISQRVQTSIRGNLMTWLGSAALIGLVLAKLLARKKKVYINAKTGKTTSKKSGLLVAGLGIAFQMARPFLQKALLEQAHILADKHLANRASAKTAQPNFRG